MDTKSLVSIVECDSYDQSLVETSLEQTLDLIGGLSQFIKPGQKVLIKPNLLASVPPEAAITTHPSIIHAVVKEVVKAGGIALVGDAPGNALSNVPSMLEETGIKRATEEAGGKVVYFQQEGVVDVPNPSGNKRMPSFKVSRLVLEADVIINLPKLKTHNLILFTGAIKNMFGAIPGFQKAQFHAKAPRPHELASLLVDVFQTVKPTLNIMDAVIGIEGKGPGTGGETRKLGAILASTDAVALDAVSSCLIGFDPLEIDTTAIAYGRGLGEAELKKIEIIGEKLENLRKPNWKHPFNLSKYTKYLPEFVSDLLTPIISQAKINPEIDQEKCTKCLVCVKNCPVKTIKTHPPIHDKADPPPSLIKRGGKEGGEFIVTIDLKNCINCFCCHELCEYKAVKLKPSWLTRLLGIPV